MQPTLKATQWWHLLPMPIVITHSATRDSTFHPHIPYITKTRFPGLIFLTDADEYGSSFDAVGSESCCIIIVWNNASRQPLAHSRSLILVLTTDREPICNLLLVNNTNLYPISHHFQVIMANWSNNHFRLGVPLFIPSFIVNPWTLGLWNLISNN